MINDFAYNMSKKKKEKIKVAKKIVERQERDESDKAKEQAAIKWRLVEIATMSLKIVNFGKSFVIC